GCFVAVRRAVNLAGTADTFRVGLQLNAVDVGPDDAVNSSSNTGASLVTRTSEFSTPPGAGSLQIRLQLRSAADATQGDGVHVDRVSLECAETPGPHNYDFKNGTSMASPHVAGAAALLVSRNPAASTTEIRDKLLSTVDPKGALSGATTTGGRLNIGTAMARMPADTAITSGPGEGEEIGTPTATFGVSSRDPAATYQCSLDAGSFANCSSGSSVNVGPLAPGPHSVAVRSVDPRGNADTTPATRSFAVESDAPETGIRKGPKKRTKKRKATFAFSADEPGSTFECKLDRKPFAPCRSPRKVKKLKAGKHKFLVRATDAVGNVDPTPAKKRWTVQRTRKR
ncbi:MAG TPA: S8 family serine peptidase, partial [Thermomicrobiales bacterium]|nr:S8 family serine peptidase [Thermomicrobiales bacterium]